MSTISCIKSVSNIPLSDVSRKSTTFTMINKLEKQLNEEKLYRERMQSEIEDLKRMNN